MTSRPTDLPIRLRIALTIFTLSLGVLCAMAFAVYHLFGRQLEVLLDETLGQRAAANQQLVVVAGGLGLRPVGDPAAARARGEVLLRLYDATGRLVADDSPAITPSPEEEAVVGSVLASAAPIYRSLRLSDNEDYRVLASPVVAAGGMGGVLLTGIERSEVTAPLDRLRLVLLSLLPVTAALLGAGAFAIARRALQPVAEMTATARRIAAGDPRQRSAGPTGHDELGELARTLNEMMGRLAATAARERRFTADAAHELRTPLAATIVALEVTLSRERDADAYRLTLLNVQRQVGRLERLARQLLLLSRLDARTPAAEFGPLDLCATVALVVDEFATRYPAVPVAVDLGARCPLLVSGDEALVTSAVRNLLDNAAIHGGPTVRVAIALRPAGDDDAEVRVCDDGPGVDPSLAPHVFQRFRLGDQARRAGGSGLGLSIVEGVARAHGGSARLEPGRAGSGGCFVLRLPRERPAAP